jgi:hypothetical protein
MSMRTPNYVTNEVIRISNGRQDEKIIPIGAFVRPIEWQYVPVHIKEKWPEFKKDTEIFVYTRFGIVPVNRTSIRESIG